MGVADYLEITVDQAAAQWRQILTRVPSVNGQRQATFLPIETLMCAAAMHIVEYSRLGSSTMHKAGAPAPELAQLFRRPVSSIVAKMNNLDGRRPRGAKYDLEVGLALAVDQELMSEIYRLVLAGARVQGIGPLELPDFLNIEGGGDLHLLGQDELDCASVEAVMEKEIPAWLARTPDQPVGVTEKFLLQYLRMAQSRFANGVLHNCHHACLFCGFTLGDGARPTLLRAGHIKPWKDSVGSERLDVANGIAACPPHDAAFDAGLMTVDATPSTLTVRLGQRLQNAVDSNAAAVAYFGPARLRRSVPLTAMSVPVAMNYLDWHRKFVFDSGVPSSPLTASR